MGMPWEDAALAKKKEKKTKGKPWQTAKTSSVDIFAPRETVGGSDVRGGIVDFLESSVGLGDELDALYRRASGDSESWDEAIGKSQKMLDSFERANPNASKAITALGFGAAFLIPGAGAMRIAQTGSKLARAGKMAALTGVEGAAYGYASGRGDERLQGAAIGGAAGGALGGLMGRFLTKNADDIARIDAEDALVEGRGTHIGGEEGFVNVGRAKEPTSGRNALPEDSLQERSVTGIDPEGESLEALEVPTSKIGDTLSAVLLNNRAWIDKKVGVRAGRLVEDSELMIRNTQQEIDDLFDDQLKPIADLIDGNPRLKSLLSQVGSKSKQKPATDDIASGNLRVDWNDVRAQARTNEEAEAIDYLKGQIEELRRADFDIEGVDVTKDYFPRVFTGERVSEKGVAAVSDYANPVVALKNMAEDVSQARVVAQRFGLDLTKIKVKKNQTRLDAVIKAVEKQAKKEGATSAVAANLGNGLRSVLIASKKGGDAAGSIARKVASTSLLATPFNAILNISEGITAPLYQNGIKAWAQSIPGAIKATLASGLSAKDKSWLSNKDLGLDRQFMGELSTAGTKDATKLVDTVSKFMYGATGVATVNRVSQEILSNSAVKRGINLAKKGDLKKLANHDGARGLTKREVEDLSQALINGDVQNPAVRNFAAVAMNKWQPVSASSMPKAFTDHPNGRVFYSMLSYMNKQMNSIKEDIGGQLAIVSKRGLNSKEGADAFKQAMKASAKYTTLFGVFAGVWDDARKTLDFSNDRELEDLLTPEGITNATLNQVASNLSSGALNIRAEEFGGSPVEPIPAPISMGMKGLSAVADLATGDVDPLLRFGQTYVPGLSQLDKLSRIGAFSPEKSAERIMRGRAPKGQRLFEDLLE